MSSELTELADKLDDAEGSYNLVRRVAVEVASALRALASQEKQEPVAWGRVISGKAITISRERTPANDTPLYTAPQKPPPAAGWDEAIEAAKKIAHGYDDDVYKDEDMNAVRRQVVKFIARDIEALRTTPAATKSADAGGGVRESILNDEWSRLVEKDDRTSPEEYPEMCLITREEVGEIIDAALFHQPAPVAANASVEDDWRTMETAPRDGTKILWNSLDVTTVIKWPEYREYFDCGLWMPIPSVSRAKATKGKAGNAGGQAPVRSTTTGTGLRVGVADAAQPATSEIMDATAGRDRQPNASAEARLRTFVQSLDCECDSYHGHTCARCKALSAHPHASDCDKYGCMGDMAPGDPKDLAELLAKPSVLEPSDRTADVTATELARFLSEEYERHGSWLEFAHALLDAYGMWRR